MAFDTDNVLQATINVLVNNTSTLIASITSASSIIFIKEGDPREAPTTIDQYPGIFVRVAREEEEFSSLSVAGSGGRNKHQLEIEIVPLMLSSIDYQTSDKDIRKITRNIKTVLHNNITLSSTALWSIPESVDYFPADLDGTYVSASVILLRTHHLNT